MNNLQQISGIPIPFSLLGIVLQQPKLKDIAFLGTNEFFQCVGVLKGFLEIKENPKSKFLQFLTHEKKQDVFSNFFILFLPDYMATINQERLIFAGEDYVELEDDTILPFFEILCEICYIKKFLTEEEKPKVANSQAAAILKKIQEGERKMAEYRASLRKGEQLDILSKYAINVAAVTSNTLEQVLNMTIYQIVLLAEKYLTWEAYDAYIKSLLAGAKEDKQKLHWFEE